MKLFLVFKVLQIHTLKIYKKVLILFEESHFASKCFEYKHLTCSIPMNATVGCMHANHMQVMYRLMKLGIQVPFFLVEVSTKDFIIPFVNEWVDWEWIYFKLVGFIRFTSPFFC